MIPGLGGGCSLLVVRALSETTRHSLYCYSPPTFLYFSFRQDPEAHEGNDIRNARPNMSIMMRQGLTRSPLLLSKPIENILSVRLRPQAFIITEES